MLRINQHPSWSQLRLFGVVLCLMIGSVAERFGRRAGEPAVLWVCGALALVVLVGFFFRRWMRWLYLGLCYVTFPLGFVVSYVLLAVTFWGFLTPLGLVLRLWGHDPLQRTLERSLTSYWRDCPPPRKMSSYFNQY